MVNKQILDITDAPTWTKLLPLVGIAAGVGLAVYQKKDCIGCFLGYGLSGMLLASTPFLYHAKKAGNNLIVADLNDLQKASSDISKLKI